MRFRLYYTIEADSQLKKLEKSPALKKRFKAVRKTLGLMEINLKHPSLNTHKYTSISGPNGEDVFESYAENKTLAAFRIFWVYGPKTNQCQLKKEASFAYFVRPSQKI